MIIFKVKEQNIRNFDPCLHQADRTAHRYGKKAYKLDIHLFSFDMTETSNCVAKMITK